jgi:hypothetical protein
MKTLMIYSDEYDLRPKFYVFEEDLSRFNQVFINEYGDDENKQEALSSFLFKEGGIANFTFSKEFPLDQQPFD